MEIEVYCANHSMYQLEIVIERGKIDARGNLILPVVPCPRCWNEGYEQGYEQGLRNAPGGAEGVETMERETAEQASQAWKQADQALEQADQAWEQAKQD